MLTIRWLLRDFVMREVYGNSVLSWDRKTCDAHARVGREGFESSFADAVESHSYRKSRRQTDRFSYRDPSVGGHRLPASRAPADLVIQLEEGGPGTAYRPLYS